MRLAVRMDAMQPRPRIARNRRSRFIRNLPVP